VETSLRLFFRAKRKRPKIPALPTFHGGVELIDVADRNALYDAMEGDRDRRLYGSKDKG
jgi:hypothetical protein